MCACTTGFECTEGCDFPHERHTCSRRPDPVHCEVSQWGATDEFGQSNTGGALGLEVVAGALVLTSASAVATEYAYKVTDLPLSRQNVILYTYGCSLNLLTALVWRSLEGQSSVPFTRGFTAWTWAVVAAQADSGYAIGALLKYVDAIGQVFADVIAMLITVVFSVGAIENLYLMRRRRR